MVWMSAFFAGSKLVGPAVMVRCIELHQLAAQGSVLEIALLNIFIDSLDK